MIPVQQAKALIKAHTVPLKPVTVPVAEAAGCVLAEDVFAAHDIPGYRQSSMDGYALAFSDAGEPMRIMGEQAAGDGKRMKLEPGTAMRIFTGAAVPDGADTIVMQEKAEVADGVLRVDPLAVKQGDHIRPAGSEIKAGACALAAGQLLTPPAIGFLSAIGIHDVSVIPDPRVAVIVTGNELVQPGEMLGYGQVYEASSFALKAALEMAGIRRVQVHFVKDDVGLMSDLLERMLEEADMVLMTGGVSVGDHDHTAEAAARCGVEKVFHRVKQRPGKPLFFGTRGQQCFFGLPGNPSSVMTCYYEYVLECLLVMTRRPLTLRASMEPLAHDHTKPAGLTHFLKGQCDGDGVRISGGQESYKLHSFAVANCLVVVPEEITLLKAGDMVEIHWI